MRAVVAKGSKRIWIAYYSCKLVFVCTSFACVQNFSQQKSSFLVTHCCKIYQHSANDMSVHQELLLNINNCNKNCTSVKETSQARGSHKPEIEIKMHGFWVHLKVRTVCKSNEVSCRDNLELFLLENLGVVQNHQKLAISTCLVVFVTYFILLYKYQGS